MIQYMYFKRIRRSIYDTVYFKVFIGSLEPESVRKITLRLLANMFGGVC